jgi:hypothetical protein
VITVVAAAQHLKHPVDLGSGAEAHIGYCGTRVIERR